MPSLLSHLPPRIAQALAAYPPWLVWGGAALAAVLLLWLVAKLLKLALYLAAIALVAALALAGAWLLLNALHALPPALSHP